MSSNPGKSVTIYQFSELFSKAWRQAMTPGNFVSGFRATGAFPVDRRAIVLPGERVWPSGTPTTRLAKRKGINYMPFYSPSCEHRQKSQERAKFTEEEDKKFRSRYEEGYELDSDMRYNLWLEINHPSSRVQLFMSSPEISSPKDMPLYSSTPLSPSASPSLSAVESTPLPTQQSISASLEVKSKLSVFLLLPRRKLIISLQEQEF